VADSDATAAPRSLGDVASTLDLYATRRVFARWFGSRSARTIQSMSVGFARAHNLVEPAREHVLWQLVRGDRRAEALVREWPHGEELCVFVDGQLRWSKLFRSNARDLELESNIKRQALYACQWADASNFPP